MRRCKRRLLYVVGGRRAASRVDVAVLFGRHLSTDLFDIDWVVFDPEPSVPWRCDRWHGARAYWIGRAAGDGVGAAIWTKLVEFVADVRTFLLAMRGDHDLIQVRDKFLSAAFCLLAARLRGKRFAYWLSYPFPESRVLDAAEGRARVPWFSWMAGKLSAVMLYRLIVPSSDHVFVQSRQMMFDVASASGVTTENMTAVPMGIDAAVLDLPRGAAEPNTVLYLGTLARVRRLEVLIEAMAGVVRAIPDARLVFVGEGDSPADRQVLEEAARACGLDAHIQFTGRLPMDEALARAATASVCVSPFYPTFVLRSTSPTKLIEYMALGRPVVVNDHPEQAQVIADSGAGYCVDWSPESFCAAILRLLKDPAKAEELGARGPKYVRSHRTYSAIADLVSESYCQFLGG